MFTICRCTTLYRACKASERQACISSIEKDIHPISKRSSDTNLIFNSAKTEVMVILPVVYNGAPWNTFLIFMKKKTLIFFYTCFYVKMTKNNKKFNMLKTTKNYKSQLNQKFNLLKKC